MLLFTITVLKINSNIIKLKYARYNIQFAQDHLYFKLPQEQEMAGISSLTIDKGHLKLIEIQKKNNTQTF
jgi:hypothetical protein